MTARPCVVCGEPSPGSRCPDHVARPKEQQPSRKAGYDAAWDRLSVRARALQPWCSDCGATTDLAADHSPEAWARKAAGKVIRLADVDVVCRDCNLRRGPARGPGAARRADKGGDPTPLGHGRGCGGRRLRGYSLHPDQAEHPQNGTRQGLSLPQGPFGHAGRGEGL